MSTKDLNLEIENTQLEMDLARNRGDKKTVDSLRQKLKSLMNEYMRGI